jgi:protein-tyrosine phosphatase
MFSFFKKSKVPAGPVPESYAFLGTDMHSHILPGIDDGAPDVETAVELVRGLIGLGYKKLIASPHVFGDFYPNTNATIDAALRNLREALILAGISVEVDAVAEYYLDNYFLDSVLPHGLRHFSNKEVVVEVSIAGWPRNFEDLIFSVQAEGYIPILAHPERYEYENSLKPFETLRDKGVLMQLNLLSVLGYYGKGPQAMALQMMDAGLYTYCGTDLHHARHLRNTGRILSDHPDIGRRLLAYGFQNEWLHMTPNAAPSGSPAELG